jgi:thioredoxin reductase
VMEDNSYDVAVVGGGPAGLAAGLWLARYRLRSVVLDAGNPRNAPTWGVHGYLGLEDPSPWELRRIGREQAERAGAEYRECTVIRADGEIGRFEVGIAHDARGDAAEDTGRNGSVLHARRLLFATGLRDIIPEIPGLDRFYGETIWHCPDCDGPTVRDLRVGVIGWGTQIAAVCMQLLTWTDRVEVLTHGHDPELAGRARDALERNDIEVVTAPIVRLEGTGRRVERAVFGDGTARPYDALFFHIAYGPGSSLPAALGCEANDEGILRVDEDFETTVPGVFAAGDIVHGAKLAISAAAEGTRAAIGIYRSLIPEERRI